MKKLKTIDSIKDWAQLPKFMGAHSILYRKFKEMLCLLDLEIEEKI